MSSESRSLPPVRIGDEHRFVSGPVHRTFGKKDERLPSNNDLQIAAAHPAARSRTCCILRILSASFSDESLSRVLSMSIGKASGGVRFGFVTTSRAAAIR